MCYGVWIQEQDRSDSLPSFLINCLVLGQFWSGVTEGMFGTYCWLLEGGLTTFPWVPLPCLMVLPELHTPWPCGPTLAPEALQGVGASSTLCTTLYTILHMLISLTWGFNTCPIGNWRAASRSGLAQASPTIVGVWVGRSGPVCPSPPMTPVPWAIGGTGRATTLLCPSQGSHQPCYLVPQLFWARGYLSSGSWSHLDFCLFHLAFCPSCCDHQFGVGGLGIAI